MLNNVMYTWDKEKHIKGIVSIELWTLWDLDDKTEMTSQGRISGKAEVETDRHSGKWATCGCGAVTELPSQKY